MVGMRVVGLGFWDISYYFGVSYEGRGVIEGF